MTNISVSKVLKVVTVAACTAIIAACASNPNAGTYPQGSSAPYPGSSSPGRY